MQKMKDSSKAGLLSQISPDAYERVMENYAGIIRHKIEELTSFDSHNYIQCEGYNEYKTCSDHDKLMKIANEYSERYQIEVQRYWNQEYRLSTEPTNQMIRSLYEALERVVSRMVSP